MSKCPNCKKRLLKIHLRTLYLKEGNRIRYIESTLNKPFFHGCTKCPYAKGGAVWIQN